MSSARRDSLPARTDPVGWVDEHGDNLFRYAMRHVGKTEFAEDLVQETLVAALGSRDSFSGRSSERTWLIGILKRKIVDHFRRVYRERRLDEDRPSADAASDFFDQAGLWKKNPQRWPTGDPKRILEQREFWDVLHACISKLPDSLAGAFRLRMMEDLQADDVCQVLNITPTNLWARLHRARLLLRRCLERNWFTRE